MMEDHILKSQKMASRCFIFMKHLILFLFQHTQHSDVAAPCTRNAIQCELFPKGKVRVRIRIILSSAAAACTAKGELQLPTR